MPSQTLFFVTPELQQVLDNLPADEPRSRLEPFRAFILRWRRKGRTYRRIQTILRNECRVAVSISTLFNFVERRSKPRKVRLEVDDLLPVVPVQQQLTEVATPKPRRTPEEIAALRAAASADNHKPAFEAKQEDKPYFDYDPDKPLTNKPTKEK
jgi:hypothetical protein